MENALSSGYSGNALASKGMLGSGLAQGAGDLFALRRQWEGEYTSGTTGLQFREWLASKGIKNPALQK